MIRIRIAVSIASLTLSYGLAASAVAADPIDFNRDIRPILSDNCFQCHGPDQKARQSKLRLDTREGLFRKQGDNRVIVPGNPTASELVRRVTATLADERMPPPDSNRKLTKQQIEQLRKWVASGAEWQQHWAFQTPKRLELPKVKNEAWPRNAIDRFILARLQQEGLSPSPEADKRTLIRRVTLDLTGLPPTLEEIDAFLKDGSPKAYDTVVDRLLKSPRYGERMVWDWLDAARYADSNGFQSDPERTMWPWRDWVVRSMNANMPFDQFTIEQLAGDLLPNATVDQIVATGFNRNHMHNGEGGRIAEETRIENVLDRVETTSTVWMGLTLTCARCHDHKYDPVLQREYYQMFAFFNQTSEAGRGRGGQIAPVVAAPTPEQSDRLQQLDKSIQDVAAQVTAVEKSASDTGAGESENGKSGSKSDTSDQSAKPDLKSVPAKLQPILKKASASRQSAELQQLIDHFKKPAPDYVKLLADLKAAKDQHAATLKSLPRVMVMDELPKPRDTFILIRGTYNKPADKVAAANVPSVLPPLPAKAKRDRLTLARWLVDPSHPLTARVTVNRYWQLFFGNGLVKTSEDFGVQGDPPSHPGLLDWLATEFVSSGWNVKQMHRLIVTSATYRQSSKLVRAAGKPDLRERDPDNRLLARGPRFRLPSWMIRDQALAASGLLVGTLGGPPVKPYQPTGIWAEATFGKKRYQQDHGDKLYRRSLYTFWRRIVSPTMFFDVAKRQTCTVKTATTNTPLHALATLNDVTYVEAARALAQRVMTDGGDSADARITTAFRLTMSRPPQQAELEILKSRLNALHADFKTNPKAAAELLKVGESPRNEKLDAAEHAAYTSLCNLILNLDEFLSKQ